MKIRSRCKITYKLFLILSMMVTSSIFISMSGNLFHDAINYSSRYDNLQDPNKSSLGNAEWWSDYFDYRKLINVTNPYNEDFTNFLASIVINYSELVDQNKLQANLNDLRLVKNESLVNFYIKKDFNNTRTQTGLATIYFQINITQSEPECPLWARTCPSLLRAAMAAKGRMRTLSEGLQRAES